MSAILKLESRLLGIPSDEVAEWWPHLAPMITKALERTGVISDITTDDILEFLEDQDMQCWVAHDGESVLAVGITQIMIFPQRKVLAIPYVGAIYGTIEDWLKHIEDLKQFAREKGCTAIRGWGRKGWVKMLRPDVVRIEFDIEV